MTCRHSIDCIMTKDFHLDRTLLGQIERKWVYDCSRSFFRHSWIKPPKIGQDCSVTDYTCAVDAQSSDGEKHTGNSEWRNAHGVCPEKKTKRSHGPSFHESRTADIDINHSGPLESGDSQVGYANTSRNSTTRRYFPRSCRTGEVCFSRFLSKTQKIQVKCIKDESLENGCGWKSLLSTAPWLLSILVPPCFR